MLGDCPSLKRVPIGPENAPKLKKVHVAGHDVERFQNMVWEDATSLPAFVSANQMLKEIQIRRTTVGYAVFRCKLGEMVLNVHYEAVAN
ncbi:uncharacterized protein [Elaeis guineensis]|uniref:uncharacterized protein n=1 Tax=Elaeis guineensis var. tenera TaxID=51953 RepID=UPI003C6D5FD6